jgi:hypothetical protein
MKALLTALLCLAAVARSAAAAGSVPIMNPFEESTPPGAENRIDELVFAQLKELGLEPANRCSDAVFLRRAYLDVIGTLPTASQAREFLESRAPDKRRQLVERLLNREEFADYWAMKWSDLLRVKAEFPINLWPNAAQAYHRWIRTSLRENKPYDQFAWELLTSSGSNFRIGPVNFYRALQNREPRDIAQAVALVFLAERTERWSPERLDGLASFFAQVGYKSTAEWKEEIVHFDAAKDTNGITRKATFPDGRRAELAGDRDPRSVFADWLIRQENPWFARTLVNRVWSWLLGRGIVHEPDDFHPDNPPSNPALLAYLESELGQADFDLKHLYRLILQSATYQLSSIPKTDTPEAGRQFAHYPLRRLEAEVLIDALNQVTATTEQYSSPIPEPFTFLPEPARAIALPDGSISSSFLEMFGRPSRDTGLESERNNQMTAAQRLHLLNSSHIQRKIDQSRLVQSQAANRKPAREVVTEIYLTILSRYPTEEEVETVYRYAQSGGTARQALADLVWALVNNAEFLYRH